MNVDAMQFEFATAGTILFGPGILGNAVDRIFSLGRKALVVTGATPDRHSAFLDRMKERSLLGDVFSIVGEPTVKRVSDGVQRARKAGCDMVIGIGGGSVIDTGKAIAAMLTNSGDLTDYLEIVGKGLPLDQDSAPYVAIPTTAGTGAEVTRNAVLASPAHKVKVSMRSHRMLPLMVLVDPELSLSQPPEVTAATGMDALTQLIEAFVSRKANPITDGLCREGLVRCARSLLRAFMHGQDINARMDMSLASLFSGLALANGGLGAVHGIAGPLGGYIEIPHGVACGGLLAPVFAVNCRRLEGKDASNATLQRYVEIAHILTGSIHAGWTDGMAWIENICRQLGIPALRRFGLTEADLSIVAANATKASSMRGNPVELSAAELVGVLQQALDLS